MEKYCIMCGTKMEKDDKFCINCGSNQIPNENKNINSPKVEVQKPSEKSKIEAGVLGILVGGLGVHSFYLGYTAKGIIQIVVSLITCGAGSLWGITEGVLILLGYIKEDCNGIPLK